MTVAGGVLWLLTYDLKSLLLRFVEALARQQARKFSLS